MCAAAEQSLKEERGREGSFHSYQQVGDQMLFAATLYPQPVAPYANKRATP